MDGFFSKASSYLDSQPEHDAPRASSHGDSPPNEEETRKPASSGGYGDLFAGAQAMMNSAKPSNDGKSVDKEEKAPNSGGYGDLLASAQSLMQGAAKSSGAVDKEGETPSSGGYGDLLASAQSLMGSAKLSDGGKGTPVDKEEVATHKTTSSGDPGYGDMYASAQVLMGAAKARQDGRAADMGEVAGATANLIGAASRYGKLEKGAYGEYADKAQTYLHDYQATHGKQPHTSPQGADLQKPSSISEEEPFSSKAQESPLKSRVTSEQEDTPMRRKYAEEEGGQQDVE